MRNDKVLVIGSGAREDALVWALTKTRGLKVYCAPGNAGITRWGATCIPIRADYTYRLLDAAESIGAALTVVGPELPLSLGIVNAFQSRGLTIFGPTAEATRIESSKSFCYWLLATAKVPAPKYQVFTEAAKAATFVERGTLPVVVKADGLAAGKGVVVAHTKDEVRSALEQLMIQQKVGGAGTTVVIQEYVTGRECSFVVLTDGYYAVPLKPVQDYKRIRDDDEGPMTGGMGSFAPAPLSATLQSTIMDQIVYPTINTLRKRGMMFRGAMYFGLMLTANGPMVLEINSRFGDPETQVTLPLFGSDLYEWLLATASGSLGMRAALSWKPYFSVGVVMACKGYPEAYETGHQILGIEQAQNTGALVFHAGTKAQGNGRVVTAGGRILTVVGVGPNFGEARRTAYDGVKTINFEGAQYRKDIALEVVSP